MAATRLRRLEGFRYIGPYAYSLTIGAFDRQPLFVTAPLVSMLLTQILRAADLCAFAVLAYCFMPDHLHLVVNGIDAVASLPRFMQRAKQLSGYHGARILGAPVWQTGYFERVVRREEDVRTVVAYVLENPVRAGLVKNAEDYAFSGSGVYEIRELLEFVATLARRP